MAPLSYISRYCCKKALQNFMSVGVYVYHKFLCETNQKTATPDLMPSYGKRGRDAKVICLCAHTTRRVKIHMHSSFVWHFL